MTASLHSVQDGRSSAEVLNYYDGTTMNIPLDPRFTAAQNAQKYFKKYGKFRTAIVEKGVQLKETEQEIAYLDSVLTFIDNARTVDDLEDIRAELIENGFLKKKNARERDRKLKLQALRVPYDKRKTHTRRQKQPRKRPADIQKCRFSRHLDAYEGYSGFTCHTVH